MIIGFFLQLLLTALQFVVNLLPVSEFPATISNGVTTFWGYVNLFSMVIPVGTILAALIVIIFYDLAKFGWLFAHWVLKRLRR